MAYALRNALLPVLTITGIVFSTMLGANVLVEKVFSWPGVASYALDALLSSDYAPVQAFVLLMASIFVAGERHDRRALRHRRSAGVGRMSDAVIGRSAAGAMSPMCCAPIPVTAVAAPARSLLVFVAIFAPVLAPYDPIASNVPNALQPPLGGALGRHRPARPRHPEPHPCGDPARPR